MTFTIGWIIADYQKKQLTIDKALDIIALHPKSLAIKKAVKREYLKQLQRKGNFHILFINTFCKHFKDETILLNLLDIQFCKTLYDICLEDLESYLLFLKRFYSEKELFEFFKTLSQKKRSRIV